MKSELERVLHEPHDEARAHRNWEAIARRRHRTPGMGVSRRAIGSAMVIGLAAAAALVFALLPRAPGPLVTADRQVARGEIAQTLTTLDDGSRISLDEGARLEILENTGDHVRLWLHEGVARFDVTPGGPRRWAIETGLVTVEVLGTSFSVARTALSVTVAVQRGSVLVRGPTAPDGMRRLAAGEEITIAAGEAVAVVSSTATAAAATASTTATRTAPDRQAEEEEEGSVDPPAVPRLRDVDALRAAGRTDDAITLLGTIAEDPRAGRERALAAFTLGRLELDRRDHPHEAAAAFARAIALGLREPLLEDARARRVEALARASDVAASEAAEDYRRLHPNGRWTADVDRWSPAP